MAKVGSPSEASESALRPSPRHSALRLSIEQSKIVIASTLILSERPRQYLIVPPLIA
jgi:hypothetical protein